MKYVPFLLYQRSMKKRVLETSKTQLGGGRKGLSVFIKDSSFLKQQEFSTKNRILKNLTEKEVDEILEKRAIVFDIDAYKGFHKWKEVDTVRLQAKYGLNITMENIHNFLYFCRVHGLFPMIDKIYLDKQDISQIKEIYSIIELALKNNDFTIFNLLYQETEKLKEKNSILLKWILQITQLISEYVMSEYQKLLWNKVEKLKNPWVVSENIFVELAMRMENEVRKKIDIYSTYLQLASYKADMKEKQDMTFIVKKTPIQNYQNIPVQFTIWGKMTIEQKSEEIEKMLFQYMKKGISDYNNFCIISVNGKFKDAIDGKLTDDYKKWVNNPVLREKTWTWKQFPFFIDRVDTNVLEPAKIMYIALHILIKKYNFRNSTSVRYLKSLKKNGKIDKTKNLVIDDISIWNIFVKNVNVEKKEQRISKNSVGSLLKYSCEVYYNEEKVWEFVIFSL